VVISYALASSPFGRMLLAATDRGICAVEFAASDAQLRRRLRQEFPLAELCAMPQKERPVFSAWIRALNHYLKAPREQLTLPLDVRGTAFQIRVWAYLQQIPCGETRSYKDVAKALGSGARAVARACAANRLALLVPCHRVIRGDGGLGGYRWGIERKRLLLSKEAG
jgi:AraC family transcriptional regulator of adaptative response/methylated-DNA-[protein]-cysteine methyltransferase